MTALPEALRAQLVEALARLLVEDLERFPLLDEEQHDAEPAATRRTLPPAGASS